ncbi:MAG: FadR family transcriptional regulator [Deltaproteobacteria bacterium]|nr:FadR family transcriptional regulator [Deltaproteobacteria bacterium]
MSPAKASNVDTCTQVLRNAILDGKYKPGDRLPSERDLAAELQVNRTALRSAIKRLSAARLLQSVHGSGTVVRDWKRERISDLIGGLIELTTEGDARRTIEDLLLLRRCLTMALLFAAVEHGNEEGFKNVERCIDAFEKLVKERAPLEALAEGNLAMVSAMVEASRSDVLALLLKPIMQLVQETPQFTETLYRDPHTIGPAWRAVLVLLRARAADQIPQVMQMVAINDKQTMEWAEPNQKRARKARERAENRT